VTAGEPVVLGIDVGTTNAKAGLVALDGRLLGSARASYAIDVAPDEGRAEQDADDWWAALETLTATLRALRTDVRIVAIAVTGHGPTMVPVDAVGRPTGQAITWLDTRTLAEQDELATRTGLRGWALSVLPAGLWLERHRPRVAEATTWYLNTWEALALRLTGRAATSLVAGQAFPDRGVLVASGLAAERVAPPVAAGSVLGGLTPTAAGVLGLVAGTPVVAGVVDAFASFHGAGLLEAGDAIDAGGTAGGFGVYVDRPVEAAGSFCTAAPLPGRHVVGGAMAATGKALDWLRDDILGGTATTEALLDEASAVGAGSDGLVFLPYLAGERSPLWNPEASGAFVGLTVRHGRGHLVRAVVEAAALAIRHIAEPILAAGVDVRSMRVCGGPARSELWNRIKADVTGFPILVPAVKETAVLGAAILGAVGVEAHADLERAIRAMVRTEQRLEPDPAARATYDASYEAYTALYPALEAVRRNEAPPAGGPSVLGASRVAV
jgi:xylulokinase